MRKLLGNAWNHTCLLAYLSTLIINQPAMPLRACAIRTIIPTRKVIIELRDHHPVVAAVDSITDQAVKWRPKRIQLIERFGVKDLHQTAGCLRRNDLGADARKTFLHQLPLVRKREGGRQCLAMRTEKSCLSLHDRTHC